MSDALVKIGYVRDAHNLKGEVFVRLFAKQADWLDDLEQVVLVKGDKCVQSVQTTMPDRFEFDLKQARVHKDGLILRFDEITDRTAAETFKGYEMYIPEEFLVAEENDVPFLNELKGFEVIDLQLGSLGVIESFATNTAQDLLVVRYNERELLIPFVKEFVEQMDFKSKTLHMNLPTGLVDFAL